MKNIVILLFILPTVIFAQNDCKQYGGLYNDEAFSITSDNNGFFYIVGSVRLSEEDFEKVRLMKLNVDGDIIFDKYFGSGYRNRAFDIIKLKNDNFLICGETWGGFNSPWGRRNIFLLEVDKNGNEKWSKYFFNYHRDQAFSLKELKSGNILIVGYSKSFNESSTLGDIYLLKTNNKGDFIFENTYDKNGNDYGFDVIEKGNGNYLILSTSGGFYNSNQFDYRYSHDADIMLIETNCSGDELNRTFWGTLKHDFGRQIIKSENDGFFIIGSTQSYGEGSFDMLLLKTDDTGNEEWFKTFGHVDFDYGISISMSDDDNFLYLLGTTYDVDAENTKILLIKTDLQGNEVWSHELGSNSNFSGRKVKSLKDGGCIVIGTINSGIHKTNDIFVQIFDKNGNVKFNLGNLESINTFPNPVARIGEITFKLNHQYKIEYLNIIEIYDINSQLIEKRIFSNNLTSLDASKLEAGMYIYKIYAKDKKITGKFIVY